MNDDNAAEWLSFDVIVHRYFWLGGTLVALTTYNRPPPADNARLPDGAEPPLTARARDVAVRTRAGAG